MAANENKGFEFANLVDANGSRTALFGFFVNAFFSFVIAIRRNASEVGMIPGVEPTACLAVAASRHFRGDRFAQQKCSELFGKGGLTDSGWADQKHRMRKPGQPLPEELFPY